MLAGVIEGFYGPPWRDDERTALFGRMAAWGLDTYVYGPKDDLHHRATWREPYGAGQADTLGRLVSACHSEGLRFVYALGPGLDIRYGNETDERLLRARCDQMLRLGVDGIALLFDDIPDRVDDATLARWGSLAGAQAHVANGLLQWMAAQAGSAIRDPRSPIPDPRSLLFCPTPYCGRMAAAHLGGEGYLEVLGERLHPDIDIFWTGPEIVSREITVSHVQEVSMRLRRPPVIWDNLHANDYDSRRMCWGPYAGRPLDLRRHVRGILSNPNTECPVNYVPLRTLAAYLQTDETWDPRRAYLAALEEWRPAFETVAGPLDIDDLVLLADCHYLPYEDGPRADAFHAQASLALTDRSPDWRGRAEAAMREAVRLRDVCTRLATLRDRALFASIHRRIWDLREEVDLVVRGIAARLQSPDEVDWSFTSDFHLPGTFRGGMVARLQDLLAMHPDGTFSPAGHPRTSHDDVAS